MTTLVTTNGPDFEDAETVRRNDIVLEIDVPLMSIPEWESRFADEIAQLIEAHLKQFFEGEYQTLEDFIAVADKVGYTNYGRVKTYCVDAFGDEKGREVAEQYEEGVIRELKGLRAEIEVPWSNIDYIIPDN